MLNDMMARLKDAHALGRLSDALVDLKNKKGLSTRAFKATGNFDEVTKAVRTAIDEGHVSLNEVASIVDEVEENGRQHIILFKIEDSEQVHALINSLARAYPRRRSNQDDNRYTLLPQSIIEFECREGSGILKYTGTTEFWAIDEEESEEYKDRIVTVKVKTKVRVVHLVKIHTDSGLVEFRIQNASSKAPKSHWQWGFEMMLNVVCDHIAENELTVVPIWKGFHWQLKQQEQTFLATDEAFDSSTRQRISLRRARGEDIRNHDDYDLDDSKFSRETLNIYWILSTSDDTEYKIHAIQQKLEHNDSYLAKIWVSRHVPEKMLDTLLKKIIEPLE